MNQSFKFRGVYLNTLIVRMIIASIILTVFMFATLDIDKSFIFLFSMIIVFSGTFSVFYLNKNYIEFIEIKDKVVEIHYFNKSFFKQNVLIISKESLDIKQDEKIITLSKDNNVIGLIPKNSVTNNSWEEIRIALVE